MEFIGRYEILQEIGRGGEGIVYAALDPEIGRKVAIKTLPVAAAQDPTGELSQRLRQEAKSSGRLSHPNIVTVHEVVIANGEAFIAMEFIEGTTLGRRIEDGTANDPESLPAVMAQTADALDYAHTQGVIHRDIKPDNILIDTRGRAKVADFGIAKVLTDSIGPQTATGMLRGTTYYMSPEQINNEPVTGKSDQFSLAVVVFECITGAKPFQADTLTKLLYQILHLEPPALNAPDSKIPEPVRAVLKKGLAKAADDRYETCGAFASALRDAYHPKPAVVSEGVTPKKESAWRRPVLIAVSALSLSAWAVQIWMHRTATPPAPEPAAPQQTQSTTAPEPVTQKKETAPQTRKPIQTTKTEPPKSTSTPPPVQQQAPPPEPVAAPPVQPPPVVQQPAKPYTGPPDGRFSWTGSIGPGQILRIAGNTASAGTVRGKGLPSRLAVTISVDIPDMRVVQEPDPSNGFQLVLKNNGPTEVSSLSIRWGEKK